MPRIEPVPVETLDSSVRVLLERAVADGRLASTRYPRILAYSREQLQRVAAGYAQRPDGDLLSSRLRELIRVRSAQLAGCEECKEARYEVSVDDDTAACLLAGNDESLSHAERLVMQFVGMMHTDHRAIDGEFYQQLARHFSIGQIIEIGVATASLLGHHRFAQTLDLLGGSEPVLSYDRSEVDAVRREPLEGSARSGLG